MQIKFLIVGASLLVASQSANALVAVQYSQIGNAPSLHLTNSGANFTTGTIGSPLVTVTLNDPFSLATTVVQAKVNFVGTGLAVATVSGSFVSQQLSTGSFSVTTLAPITFGAFTGTNILTASFTNGFIFAQVGTRTPQISINLPTGSFTSITTDFFADPRITLTDLSITTSGASPLVALIPAGGGDQKLRNFQAGSTATFDVSVVPEPGTWSLLIVGFGLVGVARRRRIAATVAA